MARSNSTSATASEPFDTETGPTHSVALVLVPQVHAHRPGHARHSSGLHLARQQFVLHHLGEHRVDRTAHVRPGHHETAGARRPARRSRCCRAGPNSRSARTTSRSGLSVRERRPGGRFPGPTQVIGGGVRRELRPAGQRPLPDTEGAFCVPVACQRVFVISRLFVLSFPHPGRPVVPSSRAAVYVWLVRSARRRVTAMRGTSEDDRSARTGPGSVSIMAHGRQPEAERLV